MKTFSRPALAGLFLLTASCAIAASMDATTRDGRAVILDENGTWRFRQDTSPVKTGALTVPEYAEEAVLIYEKSLTLKKDEKGSAVNLKFDYQNNTPKKVVGIAILVDIENPFGKVVFTQTLDDETVLQPGEKKPAKSYWSFSDDPKTEREPYDRLWQIVQNETYKMTTRVKKVIFEDGTILYAKPRSLFKAQ